MQAEASTSFPLLRKVLVSYGNNVAFEDTLQQALDSLFAQQGTGNPDTSGGGTTPTPPPVTGGGGATTDNPVLNQALQDAQAAIAAANKALAAGDFAAYGQAQKDLQSAINRAVAAESAAASTASPSPAPSSTASGASPTSTASPSPSG